MVVFHLFSRIASAWFAFILPCFRTFQALQHKPVSNEDVDRWSKYWVVIGFVIALEYTVEWLFSWFPFYWEIRTLFLLFLALPQTQGSTFVYDSYVAPFLTRNEADIDQHIESAKANVFTFFTSRVSSLLDRVMKQAGFSQASNPLHPSSATPPTQDPNGNTVQDAAKVAMNMWNTYGSPYLASLANGNPPSTPAAVSTTSLASGSSTSVQPNAFSNAQARNGFVPEAQVPLPATPEAINRAHQTPGADVSDDAPPSLPVPQHFQ